MDTSTNPGLWDRLAWLGRKSRFAYAVVFLMWLSGNLIFCLLYHILFSIVSRMGPSGAVLLFAFYILLMIVGFIILLLNGFAFVHLLLLGYEVLTCEISQNQEQLLQNEGIKLFLLAIVAVGSTGWMIYTALHLLRMF